MDTLTTQQLQDRFAYLEACCMHSAQWRPQDVTDVIAYSEGEPDGDSEIVVVELRDGGFGLMISSEDYTGHGCQCSSETVRVDSLRAIMLRLTDGEFRRVLMR